MSDPKPGDRVTPENVASLPIGTVVRWKDEGATIRATRIERNIWEEVHRNPAHATRWTDSEIADPDPTIPVPVVVRLGIVDEGVPS